MATETTLIPYVEGAAAATPAAGRVVTYAKADGFMYSKDDAGVETAMSAAAAGSVATDAIWDAAGDLVVGSGANTAARLAIGATNGMTLQRIGGVVAWALPPGYEFDYAVNTASDPAVTATTAATANTLTTGAAVTYDGSTIILVDVYAPAPSVSSTHTCRVVLYDNGALLYDTIAWLGAATAGALSGTVRAMLRFTPSAAAHTYSVRAYVNGGTTTFFRAGAGASACNIRITKV